MRFRSESCAAASGPGRADRLELRVENEQGTGLAKVIHSLTQITHTFSMVRWGSSTQVIHNAGGRLEATVGLRRVQRARSGARAVIHNHPSLRVRFSTAVWT